MNQKLLALYGLKYNPFIPEIPIEALHVSAINAERDRYAE